MTLLLDQPQPSRPGSAGAHTSADPLIVRFADPHERSRMMSVWRVIESELPQFPLLASADWTETWLSHYGDLVPHRFVTLQVDSRYAGIALLTRGVDERDGWCRERTWHVGTAGEPDADSVFVEYNGLACRPALMHTFWEQLLSQWQQDPQWDAIKLDGFPYDELPAAAESGQGWRLEIKQSRWVDLQAARETGGELLARFGDSTRKNIRQNLRKAGDVRFEWSETVEQAHHIFDDLIRLHQARWTADGHAGCYASQRFTAFHRELIDRLIPQQRMAMVRVSCGNRVLGCSQLLIDRDRVLVYQGGREQEISGSPGLITDYLSMVESQLRGYAAFDFMAGDSTHKRRLTTEASPLAWASYRRPRWKYRLMDGLRQLRRVCAAGAARMRPRPRTRHQESRN